jgi:predicted phosphodiesterase
MKLVWLGDQHVPDHDVKTNAAVFRYLKEERPDYVILGGDMLDFSCISSHNRDNLRRIESRRLQKEFDAGNKYLDALQRAVGNIPIVYLEGNHEFRVERYIDVNPQLEGLFTVPEKLKLKERGINWIKSWSETKPFRVGKALFLHGLYHSKNHANLMVQNFGSNIFYGHTHDTDCASLITMGDSTTKIAQALGCLCNYRQYYLKGRPTRWQQAFGVFWFRKDGYFNHSVVRIFEHRFVAPSGVLYRF